MRIAWLDPASGVSGDMFVGALLDAGASLSLMCDAVDGLGLEGVVVGAEKVRSHGIAATSFTVIDGKSGRPAEEAGGGFHRHPSELHRIIAGARLSEPVKTRARGVIDLLAAAEAKVHGIPVERVHFHEVGAVDTIVDIVAASVAWEELGIGMAVAGPVVVGGGEVKTMHGVLPVPAPATLELLKGMVVRHGGVDRELTTPTGAALIRHFASSFGPIPDMRVEETGCGAGKMEIGAPNVFRVVLGQPCP